MSTLIDRIFNATKAEAIRKLWEDQSSRNELTKQIGMQLLKNSDFIDDMPATQIIFITSLAHFASNQQECYDVAEIIMWGLKKNDILPSIIDHHEKELAYRCLLSLGFFKNMLIKKCNRYGAPSPDFYRRIGTAAFLYIGKKDIGKHFHQWEHFLEEFFI